MRRLALMLRRWWVRALLGLSLMDEPKPELRLVPTIPPADAVFSGAALFLGTATEDIPKGAMAEWDPSTGHIRLARTSR
jgi:hypothetical protein